MARMSVVFCSRNDGKIKEMAELLNLSTNTVVKYRTNIRKKVDSKAISDLIR